MSCDYTRGPAGLQVAPTPSAGPDDSDWYCERACPLLIVISGPSGAGKDSIILRLKEMGEPFHFVITATTRAPRANEVHGRDYYFVTHNEFIRMIQQGELLEHAHVYDQYKGVPKQQIREALASGKDVILRLDVQGAATVRRMAPQAVLIFVTTESEANLIRHLSERQTDTPAQLQKRIATAREELQRIAEFDYCVVNREGMLNEAARDVVSIMRAERLRVGRQPVRL